MAEWVTLYKEHRELLHSGRVVRVDHPDPAVQVHGVVSDAGDEALFAIVSVATSMWSPTGPVRLPGLVPEGRYRVTPVSLAAEVPAYGDAAPTPWWAGQPVLSGAVLAQHGLQAPALLPEQLVLVHLVLV